MNTSFRDLTLAFVVNILLPAGLIAGTVALVRPMMQKQKPSASATDTPEIEHEAETVEVFALAPTMARSKLESTGVTTPRQKMTLVPEVSGRVTWVSSDLTVGGKVRKGQTLVRLDKKDFELQLRTQQNQIAKAQLDLEVEKERANLAKRELALLEKGRDLPADTNRSLASRTHHLRAAKVALDAAKSGVEQARVKLARTVIRAPFDAVVLSENVEQGQVLGPNSVIATLIGADALHVRATLPVNALHALVLEGPPDKRTQAKVSLQGARGTGPGWVAYADRLMHELDTQSMDAQVLFVVQNPFSTEDGRVPLLSGSLVNLDIAGTKDVEVYKIARRALVEGAAIWTVDDKDRLHKVELQILWRDQDHVYAQSPQLQPGRLALTRPPRSGIEGAKIKRADASAKADALEAL